MFGTAARSGDRLTCPTVGFQIGWLTRRPDRKALHVPRPYPPEFRARAVALVRVGQAGQADRRTSSASIAGSLSNWVKQDQIDRGEIPGVTTSESAELRAARQRIRELETELAIVRQAATFLGRTSPAQKVLPGDRPSRRRRDSRRPLLPGPRGRSPELLQATNEDRPATQLRRQWLTGLIREVHVASRGTYGYRGCTPSSPWRWASRSASGLYRC